MKAVPRILTAWLLLASFAQAAEPIYKLRLYESQAKPLVANLRANQLHRADTIYARLVVYLLHSNSLTAMHERVQELRDLGIHAIPGMRVFEANKIPDWVSKEHWLRKTAELQSVCDMRRGGDRRLYIDCENYATKGEAVPGHIDPLGGKTVLAGAMRPYLDLLRREKVEPCITPASATDLFIELCAEACGGNIEHLEEHTFSGKVYRLDSRAELSRLPAIHAHRRALLDKYPRSKWTPGFYDEPLRDWGGRLRTDFMHAYGERDCWVFLANRKDEASLGTAEWLSGAKLSTLNDCLWFPLRPPAGYAEWQKRGTLAEKWREVSSGHAGPRPADSYLLWYWPVGERYLQDDSRTLCRASKPFTIAADVHLVENKPAAFGGMWLIRQDGHSSWQIRHADGRWHFDYSDIKHKIFRSACSVPAKVGQQRLVLAFDGAKVLLSCDAKASKVACAPRDNRHALQLGWCSDEANKPLYGESLRIKDVMVWGRALRAAELVIVRGAAVYPFGI